jgi:CDP-6-deoxy-D-xylo-4-hexulose-3-dehydrase
MRVLEESGAEVLGTYHSRPRPSLHRLDISDASAVIAALEEMRPQVVFLAGAMGHADYCEEHPAEANRINVEGTRHVAVAARKLRCRLVYYSSDYIFDGARGPYGEDDSPSPLSVYGRTKLAAERAISDVFDDFLVLRTTAVYGWDRSSRNFAMQVWDNLQAGKSMRVPSDQWGNPTLVDYLAEVSVRLVQEGASGVFNVVGKDRLARADFGRTLARAMALDPSLIVPVPTSELGQRGPRPLQGGLRTDKLARFLGTEPLNIAESLKRFRRYWRADTHTSYKAVALTDEASRLKQNILQEVKQYYQLVHQPPKFVPIQSRVNYSGRVFGPEEMVNLVDSALDFWLTLGPYGNLFEQRMKQFLGCRDFALVNSGSSANLVSVLSLMSPHLDAPLKPGDEVVTPAVTFPTTLAPIVHSGLVPVFVDCELGTYNINPHLVEGAISERTKAIMVPHTLGNPCDLDVLCDIARRHRLYLVEDTCDALGASFNGKLVGTFGDLASLSFYPAHQMTMGEGGGVIINSPQFVRIVRSVRDWGRDCWCAPGESNTCGKRFGWQQGELPRGYDHKYIYSNIGYNFKPTDMQAAIGVAQLQRVPEFVDRRRHNFARLYEGLQAYQDHLVLPMQDPRANPSWFAFPITVANGVTRTELVTWLEKANIETRELFGGNILKQPAFIRTTHRVHGRLDNTDRVMRDTFFIGVYPGLTDEMIGFVLETFREFFRQRAHRAG